MAKLTKSEVLHVAKLAKLELSDSCLTKYTSQLSKIIDYVSELSEIDTDNIEPTSQTTGLENVYREDEIQPDKVLTAEEALSGSDKIYNGYFKVKAILEGRTDK
jgi:aspartyl-tRNA(Asn)/glutamyl-tRNA(Gln) amidotransferase subunit C